MIEWLKHLDTSLFLALNGCHNSFLDVVMWHVSAVKTWVPLYMLLIYLLFKSFGWKQLLVILLVVIVAVGLSDFVSSGIIKKLACRLRPSQDPSLTGLVHILRGYKGGMYGFVSSHASTTISIAITVSWFFRKTWVMLALCAWAVFVAYSRIYLGVHYPGDIAGGLLVGILVSTACLCTHGTLTRKFSKRQ